MQNKKKNGRRTKNLVLICAFTAIVLTVSTYAWFVGLQTVHVSTFEINVKAADSLALSLDGVTFGESVTISEETFNIDTYATNTNTWGGDEGLVPLSTIGDIDNATSRMILYEKSSHTPTAGGYRIMSSRIDNTASDADKGYVAFDLFVRNYSGEAYYVEDNKAQEEAIYLTTDSSVVVGQNGVGGTGIENSVRVAFAQIGRVIGTSTDTEAIQGITCAGGGDVTGICRDTQIWEPNDKAHEQNAINYYTESCKKRTDATNYGAEACGTVADGTYVHTYAINQEFTENPIVDVYDGADLNGYTASTSLTEVDYFTDEEKKMTGMARPEFMSLAPNSITKIRVYVYLEGQDIDNYNFSQIGKQISVNFGFTKERFTEDDVDYSGPVLPTSIGVCTGGTVPGATLDGESDTEEILEARSACEAVKGVWNSSSRTCTIGTFEACVKINGTGFTPTFANNGTAGTIVDGEFVSN